MKSSRKILYAIIAFAAFKMFLLSIFFGFSDFSVAQFWLDAHPMQYIFQILFILFIISPPLIVVLLFLIWKELKNRNKLK